MQPKREVLNPMDMKKWKQSMAYREYIGFITTLNESVKNTKNSDTCPESPVIDNLLELFKKLNEMVDATPPMQQQQRFGNHAFKTWHAKLLEQSAEQTKQCLTSEYEQHADEIAVYLNDAFGNSTRIDYGTGHEMSFVLYLMCFFKCGALQQQDTKAAVLKVFNKYLELARRLQKTYNMEPAGSHGVWSLDDFQFLPFLFGSAQLIDNPLIEPRHFTEEDKVECYSDEYMFFGCIKFINSVKTGPFAEHSNQLWNISALPLWSKVNNGLMKMYTAEVLEKFPVVQHVLFGTFIAISPVQ